jgi:uncharacterized protein (DUF1330 family)
VNVSAFVVSESRVVDEELAGRYRSLAAGAINTYGGRYVVHRTTPEAVEGIWPADTGLVIVEFGALQQAHQWYASPEYAAALAVSRDALQRRLLFVDGVERGHGS